ncbi:MAG: hypothetical protein P4L74_03780 [Candidatus Doudnabacteria bacterium]|nr:hypothetical protein [Candidatus Doudnabacteria bacterium]
MFGKQFSVTFTIDTPEATATPGQLVEFSGKITNNADKQGVYLNGIVANSTNPDLTTDPSAFFQLPSRLNLGESEEGKIFSVMIAKTTLAGDYTGIVQIQGGTNKDSNDDLGDAITYIVHVIK